MNDVTDVEVKETTESFSKNIFTPQRLEGESFEDYQERRWMGNRRAKMMRKGIMFWNSKEKGTYRATK